MLLKFSNSFQEIPRDRERNFPLQGLIHTKYRSRLDPSKVMKMTYIKTNYKHLQPKEKYNNNESERLEMLEFENEKEEDQQRVEDDEEEEEEEEGVEV
jgi:hypothetical protein